MGDETGPAAKVLAFGGVVVAAMLIFAFLYVAVQIGLTADDPPRLADPGPTAPPILLCPEDLPTAQAAPTATDTGAAEPATPAETDAAAEPPSPGSETAEAEESPSPGSVPDEVECPAGAVLYAPQYRGGFDPNARLMALLAVIAPLLTTIVGFYFGSRAGAGAGEAEKQKLVTQMVSTTPSELEAFQAQLKKANKL